MRTSLLKSIIFIKINSEDRTELSIFFMKRSGYYRKSSESLNALFLTFKTLEVERRFWTVSSKRNSTNSLY